MLQSIDYACPSTCFGPRPPTPSPAHGPVSQVREPARVAPARADGPGQVIPVAPFFGTCEIREHPDRTSVRHIPDPPAAAARPGPLVDASYHPRPPPPPGYPAGGRPAGGHPMAADPARPERAGGAAADGGGGPQGAARAAADERCGAPAGRGAVEFGLC
jgi:hypothetical protein